MIILPFLRPAVNLGGRPWAAPAQRARPPPPAARLTPSLAHPYNGAVPQPPKERDLVATPPSSQAPGDAPSRSVDLAHFQQSVNRQLIRHRSVLDLATKLQESQARLQRAVAKAITQCGCIEVHARKQTFPTDGTLEDALKAVESHVTGALCEQCREIVETEMGQHLFYLTALAQILGLQVQDVIDQEQRHMDLLGPYGLR